MEMHGKSIKNWVETNFAVELIKMVQNVYFRKKVILKCFPISNIVFNFICMMMIIYFRSKAALYGNIENKTKQKKMN